MEQTLIDPVYARPTLPILKSQRISIGGMLFVRKDERLRLHGVTYGPFALNAEGFPFPENDQIHDDFQLMQTAGINSIRTYHLPPEDLLAKAEEMDMSVFVDIPWPKHVCFLESEKAQEA